MTSLHISRQACVREASLNLTTGCDWLQTVVGNCCKISSQWRPTRRRCQPNYVERRLLRLYLTIRLFSPHSWQVIMCYEALGALSNRPLTLRWRCDSAVALAACATQVCTLSVRCLIEHICEKNCAGVKTKVPAYLLSPLQTMSNLDKTRCESPFCLCQSTRDVVHRTFSSFRGLSSEWRNSSAYARMPASKFPPSLSWQTLC